MHIEIPKIVLPEQSGWHKALQVYLENKPYMRFSERPVGSGKEEFYNLMVMKFLSECDIFCPTLYPPAHGKRYRVTGMGVFFVDLEGKTLTHKPKGIGSSHYALRTDVFHLERILREMPGWKRSRKTLTSSRR